MSVRLFAEKIPTPQMLGLPESAVQMAGKRRGLILVTGASGSGRTTTMASMIDHIASNYERSILTLEKPAEYLFRSGKSMVLQREIGIDTRSYEAGLKAALKQDMDVILISEMEDLDTVSLALTAAEMGHLVIAALPSNGSWNVSRITGSIRFVHSFRMYWQALFPSSFFRDWMEADVWRRLKFFWQIRR